MLVMKGASAPGPMNVSAMDLYLDVLTRSLTNTLFQAAGFV
jgi:hypothetical protein